MCVLCFLLPACRADVTGWIISERGGSAVVEAGAARVVLRDPAPTTQVGNPGGPLFDDACPGDQAIVGFQGSVNDVGVFLVSSIQATCGELEPPSAGTTEIGVTPTLALPERGLPSGATWSQRCPAGQVVVGFSGRSGLALDQVAFDCARIRVVDRALSVDNVLVTLSPPSGGDGGMPFRIACPPGQVGRAAVGSADAWIEAFGLTCATPVLLSAGSL
jgi:hypothetical protein